jgi:GH15 family glucan-1,4-alpha-glucosidase
MLARGRLPRTAAMSYQPIDNYGLIGDLHTAALVGRDGSVDWLCLPRFDSPSVFAAILDDTKGGRFRICSPVEGVTNKQFYLPETNVLTTRFLSPGGVGEVTDFMPVQPEGAKPRPHRLVRRVGCVLGEMKFRAECRPAFNYARDAHEVEISEGGACFHSNGMSLALSTRVPLHREGDAATAEFTLREGETLAFVLHDIERSASCGVAPAEKEMERLFEETVEFWRHWVAQCTYRGRWREIVYRSALVLKLLTYAPTGAIVAAPTTSLPAFIGGTRNWDYRYTWIRDAAFTLYALMRIGFNDEAIAFMNWVLERAHELEPDGSLQIMYGIGGEHELAEHTLDHLEGYRGSRPVRIGNAAHRQLQLDIYGELMDSVYLYNKYATPIGYDGWRELRRLTNWVCDNWRRPDYGIWEVRGPARHFVYSKLMCWVALDRALRLAAKRSFPADHDRWLRTRDEIFEEILSRGWSEKKQAFVQYYDGESLDAANLIMPLVFFLSPTDPRMLSTLEAIARSPGQGGLTADSLVYRYKTEENVDGIEEDEGTFNMCTFWLVEAMTRASRTRPELLRLARLKFEKMLGYANHLGLYGEETGPCGEALGNFPQAFTHLSLISAAFNLDRALGAAD